MWNMFQLNRYLSILIRNHFKLPHIEVIFGDNQMVGSCLIALSNRMPGQHLKHTRRF